MNKRVLEVTHATMRFGGLVAAPVFNEVATGALRTLMVSPDDKTAPAGGGLLAKVRH